MTPAAQTRISSELNRLSRQARNEENRRGGDDGRIIDVEDADPVIEDDLVPGRGPVLDVLVEVMQDFEVFVGEFVREIGSPSTPATGRSSQRWLGE